MKITKRQLKRIIREEKQKIVSESLMNWFMGDPGQPVWLKFAMAWSTAGSQTQQEVLKVFEAHNAGQPLAPGAFDQDLIQTAYDMLYDLLTEIADSDSSEMAAALEAAVYGE
tara:strand:+ start:2074 stop:2409 length:336 start_codon:yes stop_codon:yes gene_type:complete